VTIAELVEQLLDGWSERIEYAVSVPVHTQDCHDTIISLSIQEVRHYECDCPRRKELRAERRKQGALCTQLVEAGYSVPVTGGGPGGSKPGSRVPGNLLRPDEILSRLADVCEVWAYDATGGLEYQPAPINVRLRRAEQLLREMATWETDTDPDDARDTVRALHGIVRQARVFLGYDSTWTLIADTRCGECGGQLLVEREGAAEVRCEDCRASYPWQAWLELHETSGPRLVDTPAALIVAGLRNPSTLYSWASRGHVTRYGGAGNGNALWDVAELKARAEAVAGERKKKTERAPAPE